MTIFDYLVLFILICSVLIGTLRGLIKEVVSLASWVVALFVANAYGENLAKLLPDIIPGEMVRLIVAFLALFIAVRLLMLLLSLALDSVIKATGLTIADRFLGMLFGVARGVVIIIVAVLVCATTAIPQQPLWRDALFSPIAVSMAQSVLPYIPGTFRQHIHF
ncbi:CvpA family protein [Glaciimonas soli]|uniref:CvpA family protein n=1 Tax=Glaciimonas soli TaxID=2590999 RepID=A0A843YRN3_9BURK|nr:CvpA family protein [Glaciimonas soli]MQQ99375.1 CvpA family protein [Glaciimonas soli]